MNRQPKKTIGISNAKKAVLHIAKTQLGLDDDEYRAALFGHGGVLSSRDLDDAGFRAVMKHFEKCGFESKSKPPKQTTIRPQRSTGGKEIYFKGRPSDHHFRHPDTGRMLCKIEAILAEAKRPWAYVHAMAQHMAGRDRVEWLGYGAMHKLLVALVVDAKRHGRYIE